MSKTERTWLFIISWHLLCFGPFCTHSTPIPASATTRPGQQPSPQQCAHDSVAELIRTSPLILKALGARIFTDDDLNRLQQSYQVNILPSLRVEQEELQMAAKITATISSAAIPSGMKVAESTSITDQDNMAILNMPSSVPEPQSILITLTPETIYKGASLLKMLPGADGAGHAAFNGNAASDSTHQYESQLNATLEPINCFDNNLLKMLPSELIVFGKLETMPHQHDALLRQGSHHQNELQQQQQLDIELQQQQQHQQHHQLPSQQKQILRISINGLHRWSSQFESRIWKHLGWDDWSDFTLCSVTCGKGVQQRFRRCLLDNPMMDLNMNMNLNGLELNSMNDENIDDDDDADGVLVDEHLMSAPNVNENFNWNANDIDANKIDMMDRRVNIKAPIPTTAAAQKTDITIDDMRKEQPKDVPLVHFTSMKSSNNQIHNNEVSIGNHLDAVISDGNNSIIRTTKQLYVTSMANPTTPPATVEQTIPSQHVLITNTTSDKIPDIELNSDAVDDDGPMRGDVSSRENDETLSTTAQALNTNPYSRKQSKRRKTTKSISTLFCEGYNIEQRNCNTFECNDDINDLLKFYKKLPQSSDDAVSQPSTPMVMPSEINAPSSSVLNSGTTSSASGAGIDELVTSSVGNGNDAVTSYTVTSTSSAMNTGYVGNWRSVLNFTLMLTLRVKNDNKTTATIFTIRNATHSLYLEPSKDGLRLYLERDNTTEMLPVKFNLYDYRWHQVAISVQNGDFISIYVDCSWTNSFIVSKRLFALPLDADVEIGRGFNGELQQLLVLPGNQERLQCSSKRTSINEVKRYIIDTFIDDYVN